MRGENDSGVSPSSAPGPAHSSVVVALFLDIRSVRKLFFPLFWVFVALLFSFTCLFFTDRNNQTIKPSGWKRSLEPPSRIS
jgi:hypothetical protein